MSGRRVDFPSEEGLAWGIELTIPLTYSILRGKLKNIYGINLPDHIDTLTYLDVSPQESLPKKLRNIRTQKYRFVQSQLSKLASSTISSLKIEQFSEMFNVPRLADNKRAEQIEKLITEVFDNNQGAKNDFNRYVVEHPGRELVIIHGHGGANLEIGEQYYNDKVIGSDGTHMQKHGNIIHIDEILQRYNDPNRYSAILLHNCHGANEKVKARNVPVFMPIGHIGGLASMLRLNKTQTSIPGKDKNP